jgi:gluconate 2-dehydrogenase alpha chain
VRRDADVVVVGLGAAGGIAAHVLTAAGLEVVGLEAGPRLDRRQMRFDELHSDIRNWMSDFKAKHEVPTWREDPAQTAHPSPWPMLMANGVGGSSVHYECVSFRFLPWVFRSRTLTAARYGTPAIPAGSTVADWPLSYDELEPFYDLVEKAIGVSGQEALVGEERDPRGNPFEGRRSHGYPMPPLRRTGWAQLMADAGTRLGWHPYPAPAAINTEVYNGNPMCTYCGFCQSNGCYVNAKGSTAATVIPSAEATGRLRVETCARVVGVDVDARGLARGVRYIKDGIEQVQPARVVVLATYTFENVRLLLLSECAAFPRGLANGSDQVGRHFIAHVTPFVFGLFPDRPLNLFNGTIAQATCVDDFNGDNFDHVGLGFSGGGVLFTGGEFKPIATAGGPAVAPNVPRWGTGWKRWLHEHARSIGSAFAEFEALSYDTNYLDLDPSVRDPLGIRVIRVTHALHQHERAGGAFLAKKLTQWLREAGAVEVWSPGHELLDGRHVYGGTRMGDDAATSVVDRCGLSHEVPNLAVIGASTFPTAGGHNPTLTVQATAWRTAQHIIDRWRTITDT